MKRGREEAARQRARGAARRAPSPAPELPLSHPAMLVAGLATALLLALAVTFPLVDTDFWQHLAVGRAIWSTHSIPMTNVWTWPTWGEPQVLPSWGFRALLWPFWALGGVTGLFAWRWLTTLAAFGIAWATARRLGARGFTPFVAFVMCALVYRNRSQVRPETLVAVLLALETWLLERRRHPAPAASGEPPADPARPSWWRGSGPWLVTIAWIWANAHISYYLGLALLGIHWLCDRLPAGRGREHAKRRDRLGLTLIAATAISFVNPFGWRALAQPFEYFFLWRHEPLFMTIGELGPIQWSDNLLNGLPLVMLGWPLLALLRARREGWDRVELLTAALFLGLALTSQRFLGPMAIACAPYFARDLDAFVRSCRWPPATAAAWARAGLAIAACAALLPLGWQYPDLRPGIGLAPLHYPRAACDWIAAHGVRGRSFNQFEQGGYLLWRFWPERARLPFMDIHQTGTRQDRLDYVGAMIDPGAWGALDERHRFEWVLLKGLHAPDDRSLDHLDADSSFRLVFADDAAALYLKRRGPLAAIADSFAYHFVPAGEAGRIRIGERCVADAGVRAGTERELRRAIAESPLTSGALSVLTSLLMFEDRWPEAREALAHAERIQPLLPLYRERMKMIEDSLGVAGRPPGR